MKDLIIAGAGGLGREVLETIKDINRIEAKWNVLGFINDEPDALDGFACDKKILGSIKEWERIGEEEYVLAIADPFGKETVVNRLKSKGCRFATIVHPTAKVGEFSSLGEGAVLFSYAGVSVNVAVGDFVFMNSMAGVGHNAQIGNYATIGPKCCIAGGTRVGNRVEFGAMASTYPNIAIEDDAKVGMNSVVIRKVKQGTTVFGIPAKRI